MTFEVRGFTLPQLEANADLSALQYRFVNFDSTSGKLNTVATAGAKALGVLQNNPLQNQSCTVSVDWPATKIVLGDTVTQGGELSSDNAGRAIPATTGHQRLGVALQDGVVGDIIAMRQTDRGTL